MKNFNFEDLFIFDLANNHQGDVKHALNVIKEVGNVVKKKEVRGVFKFQFRQLDTFIHPDFKKRDDVKHIPRFLSTALQTKDYSKLAEAVKKQGMITMSTPFDEESVDIIKQLNLDIIKVASCSAFDWPLLKKIADANKPVIVSTAGLNLNKIDMIVSFFETKGVDFALMHCVAIYPTPTEMLNLNQITLFKERYPNISVGFSTHEEPSDCDFIKIAYAKGARLFERHVGLNTKKYELNTYSSTPDHLDKWISAYLKTVSICGGEERSPASLDEIASLNSLKRGVYAKKIIKKGDLLTSENVFYAMPLQEGQLASDNWIDGIISNKDYDVNTIIGKEYSNHQMPESEVIYQLMLQVKAMLNQARIFIGMGSSVELSHHYGLEHIREFGAIIIDCINRSYCKKLIVLLPRQKHPYHFHKKKEETFQLLYGDMEVELNGHKKKLEKGETFLVKRNEWHKFHSLDGAIFEEISTTHYNDDSFYEDEKIAEISREKRKTSIPNWEVAVTR